jgi:hypothetical protein
LIFRCSSSSVLYCHSSFFWCVLPTTMPTTLAASVESLHCHLTNPLFPPPYKWRWEEWVSFFHTAYCSWNSLKMKAATASETLITVYHAVWCDITRLQSSVLDYILNKYLLLL